MNTEAYNKGREICLSGKFKDTENYYDYRGGFTSAMGTAYVSVYPQHTNVNGLATTPEWKDFVDGWNSVYHDKQEAKRKQYCVDDFLTELRTLCKKYDVVIYSDYDYHCGRIKDYEFSLDTP